MSPPALRKRCWAAFVCFFVSREQKIQLMENKNVKISCRSRLGKWWCNSHSMKRTIFLPQCRWNNIRFSQPVNKIFLNSWYHRCENCLGSTTWIWTCSTKSDVKNSIKQYKAFQRKDRPLLIKIKLLPLMLFLQHTISPWVKIIYI